MAGPLLLATLALAALFLGRNYEIWSIAGPGPGLLPAVGGTILLVASLASIRREAEEKFFSPQSRLVAGYVAGLLALPPAVFLVGMLPAMAIFTIVVLLVFEKLRTRPVLIIAAANMLGSWILFEKLLGVSLPKPLFW